MNHVTVGVYNNDTYKVNIVRPEHLADHIEYNKTWRWGRALFVDGKCVYQGYLDDKRAEEWTQKISNMIFDTRYSSEPYV